MARIGDVSVVIKKIGFLTLCKRVWQQISEDAVYTWGAALAYSWLFAIFPFIVFLMSLVPFLPDRVKPNVKEDVSTFVEKSLPPDAASLIMKQVDSVLAKPSAGGFLSFGLLLTIWAASGGMAMTMSALDKAYDIDKGRSYIKQRSLAIAMTIVVATLLILMMVLMPVGTGVLKWLIGHGLIPGWLFWVVNIARYLIGLALMFAVLSIIYYWGPSFRQKFQAITPGAAFCVVVWLLVGFAFKIYLTKFGGAASYNKTYGAVAGAAILLLFFYVDALVLLVGAEINSEIDFAVLGIPSGATPEQQAVATEAKKPEDEALAQELLAKRAAPAPAAGEVAGPAPGSSQQAPAAPSTGSQAGRLLLVAGATWLAAAFMHRRHREKPAPQQQIPPGSNPSPPPSRAQLLTRLHEIEEHDGMHNGRR